MRIAPFCAIFGEIYSGGKQGGGRRAKDQIGKVRLLTLDSIGVRLFVNRRRPCYLGYLGSEKGGHIVLVQTLTMDCKFLTFGGVLNWYIWRRSLNPRENKYHGGDGCSYWLFLNRKNLDLVEIVLKLFRENSGV